MRTNPPFASANFFTLHDINRSPFTVLRSLLPSGVGSLSGRGTGPVRLTISTPANCHLPTSPLTFPLFTFTSCFLIRPARPACLACPVRPVRPKPTTGDSPANFPRHLLPHPVLGVRGKAPSPCFGRGGKIVPSPVHLPRKPPSPVPLWRNGTRSQAGTGWNDAVIRWNPTPRTASQSPLAAEGPYLPADAAAHTTSILNSVPIPLSPPEMSSQRLRMRNRNVLSPFPPLSPISSHKRLVVAAPPYPPSNANSVGGSMHFAATQKNAFRS